MKEKILITGSCGFVGSNLVRKLIFDGKYNIVSMDRIENSSLLSNIYVNKSHQFYLSDCSDEHIVNRIFEFEEPQYIIHLSASKTNIGDNQKSVEVLLGAARKYNIKKFIFLSTDQVYGDLLDDNKKKWTESDATNKQNASHFVGAKIDSEQLLVKANKDFGLDFRILRSANNFGPRQFGGLIPSTIKSIFENKKISVFDQGMQIRDWLHTFDCTSAILKVLEDGAPQNIYNISAGQEFSNIEVVQMICNAMGTGHQLIEFKKDTKPHGWRYATNSSKLRALGWAPQWKLKSGLKYTIEWYASNKFFLNK